MLQKIFRFLGYLILVLVLLLAIAYVVVQQPKVQNWLAQKVTKQLENKLGTPVSVENVSFTLANHVQLNGLYIADKSKDTLLYAGNVQMSITDWFFLKKEKPEISFIAIENAFINLKRIGKDSTWNYGFILDSFASKNTNNTLTTHTKTADTTAIAFDLKKIILKNTKLIQEDEWLGKTIDAYIGDLLISANELNLKKKTFDVSKITINKTIFNYREYTSNRGPRPRLLDTTAFNKDNWKINCSALSIDATKFVYNNDKIGFITDHFDHNHLAVDNIDIKLNNLSVNRDTITAHFKNASLQEKCGFKIKQLQADVVLNPVRTKLSNLNLQTNNSIIKNYYEMQYNNFRDFEKYITKVVMKGNLENATISFADIAYFAPAVKKLTVKEVTINKANVLGTVNNLICTNIDIKTRNSVLLGNLSLRGLPNINETFIELESKNLATNGKDVTYFVPAANVKSVNFAELNTINFKGTYKGYFNDFKINGNLQTNFGNINNDLHLTFLKGKEPTYDGYFKTENLEIGKIINQKVIGKLVADGKIKGEGFTLEKLNTTFNGNVSTIETPTYTYTNLKINGTMANKTFDGAIVANDPNLQMDFKGKLNLNAEQPVFVLKSNLINFNLKKIGITTQDISGKAKLDLNFKGKTVDDFIGSAKLYNVELLSNNKKINLDSALINSATNGSQKIITLKSSAADAELKGNFTIKNLPKALQYYLSFYIPQYINKPSSVALQNFDFNVQTKNIETILQTFVPNIKGCDNATIIGALNMQEQYLNLNAEAPYFGYKNFNSYDVKLKSTGDYKNLKLTGGTGVIVNGTNTIIPSSTFEGTLYNDSAVIAVHTTGGTYNVKNADLFIKGFASKNIFYVNVLPSSFYLYKNKWDIFTSNEIIINKKNIYVNHLHIENGLEKIAIKSIGDNNENLIAIIENLDMDELNSFATKPINLHGRINGIIKINNYQNEAALSGNISTSEIRFKDDNIGSLVADVDYDKTKKIITISNNSGLLYKGDKSMVYGTIDLKNEKDPTLDINVQLKNTNLKAFENFFDKFIANTNGYANGNISINGPVSKYKLDGSVTLKDVTTKIIYLGTTYNIANGKVDLTETEIKINPMQLVDEEKNVATLDGTMYHNRFANLRFGKEFGTVTNNLKITGKKFMFLNTTATDNPLYYGRVIANGTMNLSGPLENLDMEVIATTLPTTVLTLPIRESYDGNKFDFIKFKSYTTDVVKQSTNVKEKNRLKIDLLINATPDALINVLMDPNNDESIVGKGTGTINMNIDLNNNIRMNGAYTLDEGNYGFRFRNTLRKDLTVEKGGTITWTGKPLEAELNIVAKYAVVTNLAPLLGSESANASQGDKTNFPTNALIRLTGKMLKPDIKYDIIQEGNFDVNSLGNAKLTELKSNDQKMLTQVVSIIMSKQFLNTESGNGANLNTTNIILNTVSGIVTPTLSNILSQQANKLIGTKGLQVVVDYVPDAIQANKTDLLNVTVRKSFLDNRIQFEVGDNIEYQRGTNKTSYTAIPSDFKFKYLVDPNGNLTLSLFRTTFTDFASTERDPKIGIGINVNRNYNKLEDIWRRRILKPSIVEVPIIDSNKNN